MRISVAGAGAGKTTKMADRITSIDIPEGKIVFCIAFTNAAADNIEKKVAKRLGTIPNNIRISTIHSFLYQELIYPYYYFLYGIQYEMLSNVNLPSNYGYRQAKLSELEAGRALHITKIPEKAKWIVTKKAGDKKDVQTARESILNGFSTYCAAIFVDEAQDIGEDVRCIFEALDKAGVEIFLFGDPKQDVKGLGQFRALMNKVTEVTYDSTCHRCPQIHLNISNTLAPDSEKQVADITNAAGSIEVVYESDVPDLHAYLALGNYGLQYISMKRDRFATHEKQEDGKRFETLRHEIERAMIEKWKGLKTEIEIKRAAYYISERILDDYNAGIDINSIIQNWIRSNAFDVLARNHFAQIATTLKTTDSPGVDLPVFQSIEIIKGREAERCLFILTTDLAPYLFGRRTDDNKTSHLLYVALTRSLDHMTIMITREVEEAYTRQFIKSFFEIRCSLSQP